MRVGAVIAAAGTPGGFRAYDKLKNTDRNVMLRRMIYTFRRAGVEDVAVVTGYRAKETEKSLAKLGAVFLRCADYENVQMLDLAVKGFQYLKNCGKFFFCPADVPLFTENTLKLMLLQDAQVVIPVCDGRKGHPVLINAGLTDGIAGYQGNRGLKGAIDASGAEICFLSVDDEGVLVRARSEDNFEKLAATEKKTAIHPKVKLQIMRNEAFFGPGMMVLLKQQELGCPVVERSPGGKSGGIAQVSDTGHILMEKYERLEREVAEFTEKKFREIF